MIIPCKFAINFALPTQLIITVNDFAECLNKGGQCDVLALDFSKAFDKVLHAHLYQKLSHYMEYVGPYCRGFRLSN